MYYRVGRTARGEAGTGHALLILRPEELGFLRYLKQAKVALNEFEFSWAKIANIQLQLEKLIEQNYFLNKSAKVFFSIFFLGKIFLILVGIMNIVLYMLNI